jgi:hypothetical protein
MSLDWPGCSWVVCSMRMSPVWFCVEWYVYYCQLLSVTSGVSETLEGWTQTETEIGMGKRVRGGGKRARTFYPEEPQALPSLTPLDSLY